MGCGDGGIGVIWAAVRAARHKSRAAQGKGSFVLGVAPAGLLILALPLAASAVGQDPSDEKALLHAFEEEMELKELLRYFSSELGVGIDWDPGEVQGRLALRTGPGVSLEGLWATANRLLLSRGLASIQVAGEETLSVVKVEQAAGLAQIETEDPSLARAGYIKVLRRLVSREPDGVAEALKGVLPKDGSVAVLLQGSSQLLIAGLKPQVLEALEVLRLVDEAPSPTVVEELRAENLSPVGLASLLEQVSQKRKSAGDEDLKGSAMALTGVESVLLIAPEEELPLWRSLAFTLDRANAAVTRSYTPNQTGLRETAELIGEVVGSGTDSWRVVVDELSGCLWVSGTLAEHETVESLFERFNSADAPPRRAMRSVSLEHRDSDELVGMLENLIAAGVVLVEPRIDEAAGETVEPVQGPTGLADAQPRARAPTKRREGGLSPEDLSFSSDPTTNRVLLFGERPLVEEAEGLVRSLDVPGPQVMVETIVVSLDESEVANLGVELRKQGTAEGDLFELASLFGLGAPDPESSTIPLPDSGGFTGVVLGPGSYSAAIAALETATKGRSVSRPRVLVGNHGEARLEAVLHRPYASINATNTVATTSLGGTVDAGTSIQVTPHVTSGQKLRLDYQVSISAFIGETSDPSLPPPRQETVLESEVTVPDGHTVVIGGLELEARSRAASKVPLLGKIPLLGLLFGTQSQSRSKSRFFVFIRTSILSSPQLEDLRWASQEPLRQASIEAGWPVLEPRVIR